MILDIEVTPSEASTDAVIDVTEDEVQEEERSSERNEQSELDLRSEGITHNRIRSRLQHLELELSSVLRAVRSNGDEITLNKVAIVLLQNLNSRACHTCSAHYNCFMVFIFFL